MLYPGGLLMSIILLVLDMRWEWPFLIISLTIGKIIVKTLAWNAHVWKLEDNKDDKRIFFLRFCQLNCTKLNVAAAWFCICFMGIIIWINYEKTKIWQLKFNMKHLAIQSHTSRSYVLFRLLISMFLYLVTMILIIKLK